MRFSRPIGAVRDMLELEYVLALHQTSHDDAAEWVDGSIDAADVKAYLMSRHGIDVSKDDVRNIIFKGIAGGEVEEDACLDLPEVVSVLIIPLLVKVNDVLTGKSEDWSAQDEDKQALQPPPTIIADVLETILHDTLGGNENKPISSHDQDKKSFDEFRSFLSGDAPEPPAARPSGPVDVDDLLKDEQPLPEPEGGPAPEDGEDPPDDGRGGSGKRKFPKLTPELLRAILAEHDEMDLVDDDDLVQKMILAARGDDGKGEAVLDVVAFARALTSDVGLYDAENETRYTTILEDVLGKRGEFPDVRARNNFSEIDFAADNVRSWVHTVLVWLAVCMTVVFYIRGQGGEWIECDKEKFGCEVAIAVVHWVHLMLTFGILGAAMGIGLSFGNGSQERGPVGPLLGLVAVGLFVFFPAAYEMETPLFSTASNIANIPVMKGIFYFFGSLLALFQIKTLVIRFVNMDSLPKKWRALGSSNWAESHQKQAGIHKVNQMVKHAYGLHALDEKKVKAQSLKTKVLEESISTHKHKKKSSKEIALQNYADSIDEKEDVGGILWAYKSFMTHSLQKTEGIWLSSRFMAAVVIMFIAVLILFYFIIANVVEFLPEIYPDETLEDSETCFSLFDYDKCYFPWGERVYTGQGVCHNVQLEGDDCLGLFEEIPTGSHHHDDGCKLIDKVFDHITNATLGSITCSAIFESVEGILSKSADYSLEDFNGCHTVASADEETPAALMESAPNLNQSSVEFCQSMISYVHEAMESTSLAIHHASPHLLANLEEQFSSEMEETPTSAAIDFCMDIYGELDPSGQSMCNRKLYRVVEGPIATYEQDSTGTEFCKSYLSYCTLDPDNPSIGTCIIGVKKLKPFEFDGPTCQTYPEINSLLGFYADYVEPGINDLVPSERTVIFTATIAIVVGFIIAMATPLVYIPSSIHTLMKFRSGVIPSLRDPATFLAYRKGLDKCSYLIGSMFWGLVINIIVMVILTAGVVFLLVWEVTQPYLWRILAHIIGVAVTVALKMVLVKIFMKLAYAGFYRKKPTVANVIGFMFECWYLGLTAFFSLSRLVKFTITTALYVGRIDRPVLADGLMLDMDSLPKVFRQNLLSTEAHRHPYIELLGLIYLMKLRHKEDFGSAPGSAWRVLFVVALMPWLKKKRIQDAHLEDDDSVGKAKARFGSEVFAGVLATLSMKRSD